MSVRKGYIRNLYCCPFFKNNIDTSISTRLIQLQYLFTNLPFFGPANYTFHPSLLPCCPEQL